MRCVLVPAFTLAFAALAQSAAAQGPSQFDLVCHGLSAGVATEPGYGGGGPIGARFRVDVARNAFCVDACRVLMPITSASDDDVHVQVEDAAYVLMPAAHQFAYRRLGAKEAIGGGGCEVAPFSGFPADR